MARHDPVTRMLNRLPVRRLLDEHDDRVRESVQRMRFSLRSRLHEAATPQDRSLMAALLAEQRQVALAMLRSIQSSESEISRAALRDLEHDLHRAGLTVRIEAPVSGRQGYERLVLQRKAALGWLKHTANTIRDAQRDLRDDRTVSELLDTVELGLTSHHWRVANILTTEATGIYNITRLRAVQRVGASSVRMRWTELVDDLTGQPLDNRVGRDSLVMHGQLSVGGVFTMPHDPSVHASLQGQQWSHPPNRPNDRATLVPWVTGSGVPAWELVRGSRSEVL